MAQPKADMLLGVTISPVIASPVILSQPWWLAASLLAVVPVVLALRARRRGRVVSAFSVILQVLALAAVAIAMASPQLRLQRGVSRPYLILRDVSASTRGQREASLPWPSDLPRKVWQFASGVAQRGGAMDANATNLAPALRAAASEADTTAGIVIHTDGQFQDDWTGAAAAMSKTNVTIVPMQSPPGDARITDFSATRETIGGQTIHLQLSIAANAPRRRTITIVRTDRPDKPILTQSETTLGPITIRATDTAPADQAVVYHATMTQPDTLSENDSATLLVLPAERKVAIIASADAPFVDQMLAEARLTVERVAPKDTPADAAGWSQYAAVVLADEEGRILSEPRRRGLLEYVQSGGGLLVLGAGPHATAADRDDPLNRALPLVANPYDRKPMAVTVILDASGSMAQRGVADGRSAVKFDIATGAVETLRTHLTPADNLTVITFSDKARQVYHGFARSGDAAELHAALSRERPTGPTNIGPALMQAAKTSPPDGMTGLILVVSDLKTSEFKPKPIADAIRDTNQFLAVVATRDAGSPMPSGTRLQALASWLRLGDQAAIQHSDSLVGLADIFANFVRDHRGPAVRSGQYELVGNGAPFGADLKSLPSATSYILSAIQPNAELLATIGTDSVFARRRLGLGRSVCLALPLTDNQNTSWNESAPAAKMLASALQWCLRPGGDPRFNGHLFQQNGNMRFRLDARDGDEDKNTPINSLAPSLLIQSATSDAQPKRLPLLPTAPGQYEADVDYPPGAFTLRAVDSEGKHLWQGAFAKGYPREFAAVGVNWENLHRLAELTGGQIVEPRDVAELSQQWGQERYLACWPVIAAIAVLLMLTDWVTTRTWKRWQ